MLFDKWSSATYVISSTPIPIFLVVVVLFAPMGAGVVSITSEDNFNETSGVASAVAAAVVARGAACATLMGAISMEEELGEMGIPMISVRY